MRLSRAVMIGGGLALAAVLILPMALTGETAKSAHLGDEAGQDGPRISLDKKRDAEEPAPAETELGRGDLAAFRMHSLQVAVAKGVAHVSAEVDFRNRQPSAAYVWALRVYARDRTVRVVDRLYGDQAFSLVSLKSKLIGFTEDLRLMPGDYQAEVRLYEVYGSRQLANLRAKLDADEKVPGFIQCEARKDFSVTAAAATNGRRK